MTTTLTEHEEWCCSDCQWKILHFGIKGCVGCDCSCHPKVKSWEEHEATLNKEEVTQLILDLNKFKFKDNRLILKNYPNLTALYAAYCDLEKIELINIPNLECLNLNGNKLSQLDLTKLISEKIPPLEELIVSNNQLKELEIKCLKKLETLHCSNTKIFKYYYELF
jgi:Leucine-rich repeat (LRR) protein